MHYRILGPLYVGDGLREAAITAGRDRTVLAMLLLNAGRIVGVEELIDAVWDESPPVTARGQLQTCVSRLRRALPQAAILTNPAGYGITTGPDDDLDAGTFARLVAQGRARPATEPDVARKILRQAVDLWRGPALAGIDSRAVRQGAAILDEQHAVAIEDWVDLELDGGRDRDLVAELTGLVDRFPLRERLRAQLMLTLYRVGRQADALAEYRRVRRVLHQELGVEPGAGLRELHRQILTGEVAGAARAGPLGGSTALMAPIRALPRTVGDFTGRAGLLDALRTEIEAAPPGPLVRVIDGMPGIGKSTLAVHLAGLVGARYPDAHLFIDLHGHSAQAAAEPAVALLTLLRQLGLAADRIPSGTEERVALWRSELAGRRALIVLDNAASSAQVTPLLPGNGASLVLITSRRRLTGLDGVRPESMPVLDESEATALFTRIVGDRATAEPEAVGAVVRRCGLLPLAIRLAGARLAHRPRWRVADLLRRLGEAALPELVAEDRTVLSAFALSYAQLPGEPQRLFRVLGLNPGQRFTATAAAALADLDLDDTEDLLDGLVDVHLVEEPEPGLFRLHDLMREYAASLAAAAEGPEYAAAAITRLLDFHLQAIAVTGFQLQKQSLIRDLKLGEPHRPDLAAAVTDHAAHMERERSNLPSFMAAGVAAGRPDYAWLLPRAAWRYLFTRGYMADIVDTHELALQVARDCGDDAAVAMTANSLAAAYSRMGRADEARRMLELCLRLRRALGDEAGATKAMGNLAVMYESVGRLAESVAVAEESLRISRRIDDTTSVGIRHSVLGHCYAQLGRPEWALRHLRLVLQANDYEGDHSPISVCNIILHIASVKRRFGLAGPAVLRRMLWTCIRFYEAEDFRTGVAEAVSELALLDQADGRFAEAFARHEAAVRTAEGSGDRRFEAIFLNDYGSTALAAGDLVTAAEVHTRALAIAGGKHAYEEGRALDGLARTAARSDPELAREHWRRALAVFTRMGVPERYAVEKRLAG